MDASQQRRLGLSVVRYPQENLPRQFTVMAARAVASASTFSVFVPAAVL